MSDLREKKKALRHAIAERKKGYTMQQRKAMSATLLETLARNPHFIAAQTILLYHSLPDEVYTHDFIEAWHTRKTLLLPQVVGDDLVLRRYTGAHDMRIGAYGIAEPIGEAFTDYPQIDLAIIPGVSFDKAGNRLGRGKGYYDRLIPRLTAAYKIGICFSFQLSQQIPTEPFDQPMDEVVTNI